MALDRHSCRRRVASRGQAPSRFVAGAKNRPWLPRNVGEGLRVRTRNRGQEQRAISSVKFAFSHLRTSRQRRQSRVRRQLENPNGAAELLRSFARTSPGKGANRGARRTAARATLGRFYKGTVPPVARGPKFSSPSFDACLD